MAAALGTERPPRAGGARARLGALSHVVGEVARLEREMGLEPDPVAAEFKVEWNRVRRRLLPSPAERRAEAAEAWQVHRATIMRIRKVAKESALQGLAASKPGVRRQAGYHAQKINLLFEELFSGHPISQERLKEVLGHTPRQVLGGIVLGTIIALAIYGLLPPNP